MGSEPRDTSNPLEARSLTGKSHAEAKTLGRTGFDPQTGRGKEFDPQINADGEKTGLTEENEGNEGNEEGQFQQETRETGKPLSIADKRLMGLGKRSADEPEMNADMDIQVRIGARTAGFLRRASEPQSWAGEDSAKADRFSQPWVGGRNCFGIEGTREGSLNRRCLKPRPLGRRY
jgi:hypothetical protein